MSKTAPVKAALKPLMKIEAIKNKQYKEEKAKWDILFKNAVKSEKDAIMAKKPTNKYKNNALLKIIGA